MPKNQNIISYSDDLDEELIEVIDDDFLDEVEIFGEELTSNDYGFIISPEGELKSLFLPDDCETLPKHVVEILNACGIENPQEIYCETPKDTLH